MAPTRVHRVLDDVGSIAFAGVYDALSAKLARQAVSPHAFISGYSVAATALGEPDMGLLTQTEMIDRDALLRKIALYCEKRSGEGRGKRHMPRVPVEAVVFLGCLLRLG